MPNSDARPACRLVAKYRPPPPPPYQNNPKAKQSTSTPTIAMEFATALLPKLAKLLQEEYNLQTSARKGIDFLYRELETMHAVLRKISEVPREQLDDLQRIWARDVRELSYDMEDIVDTFMVDVEGPDPPSKRGARKILKKMIRKVAKAMARREVAQEINDIRERVRELAERRERYKLDDIAPANKTFVDPRIRALYTKVTELVGIGEAKEQVIARLTKQDADEQERIVVVSIAGFGGIGKTTLAKAVYDEIKGQFDCTAFVSVSRNPDAKKLLKDILYQLHRGGAHPGADLDEIRHLIDLVRDFLQNKRYLIVIDDIWDKEPWDKVIRLALMENDMRSRIITTTRIIDVAEHLGGCYRLKPLSDESSEILFYGRIFGSKHKCPNQFYEVSKTILKKCGGIPLAIVTTSSLLANKSEDARVWSDVCNSIGSGLGRNNPGMDDMRKILLLSYYDLPSHLKTCLLYLSIFPEDYVITKDRLIWRWVAEVLDLIISLSVEECFVTTILGDGLLESKVRRLSLHNSTTWPTIKMPKLRSFTIFSPAGVVIDLATSLSRYLLLRILDLRGYKLNDLASLGFVGSLSHLRYLGLSSSGDIPDQLPLEIGKLRFLQTLDLSETRVLELPSSVITGLGQLMCLRCYRVGTRLPDGLKKLTSLEVLEQVDLTPKCIAEELCHLTQLRVLEVWVTLSTKVAVAAAAADDDDDDDDEEEEEEEEEEWTTCSEALLESLGKLTKFECLHISVRPDGCNLNGSMAEPLCNLRRLCIRNARVVPTWIRPAWLPSLCYLEILVKHERRDDIQVLGTLPCLGHLKFCVLKGAVVRCAIGSDAFPRVVSFEFVIWGGRGAGVMPCTFPRGAMPMLQDYKFHITRHQLETIAVEDMGLSLGHLASLRRVDVRGLEFYYIDDESIIIDKMRSVREKLEQEAAAHPNHPLQIHGNFAF
ncbi:hypothetical protein PR202_gb24809 [Eleusine coracana subsp. coracana]|uniref:AAA+ ATPase domain-containing protein n=1 Tax=Eleusine coracana subsp. coracana TaxID=191504 RepID=A0AAV5FM39_ELECO|nr:hypothetical protein PR202_gb24809 [Eleusine coracana subsp. coracana]